MQRLDGKIVFSASDLVNFTDCEHLVALDLLDLESPLPKAKEDPQAEIVARMGFAHEEAYLKSLREAGLEPVNVKESAKEVAGALQRTKEAMAQGVAAIYQGCLRSADFLGYVDFLRRSEEPSGPGQPSYEVVDTKLARRAKPSFILQLCLYSDLLHEAQGALPRRMHVVLGDGSERSLRLLDYFHYYRAVKERFLEWVARGPAETYPERCARCDTCRWRDLCAERWLEDDHLNQVANITRAQIEKLKSAQVTTLAALARSEPGLRVPGIQPATLDRLRRQAALRLRKRENREDRFELLDIPEGEIRGFRRLPEPDPGDLFFDLEGDPFEDNGLEYLFGVFCHDDGKARFSAAWAHDRGGERKAFEGFIRFVTERLGRYPKMHIYHYGAYEESALKRLMSLHGTCEAEVDDLLRGARLVDLYKVVRESLLVSEPGYSLKNLEAFYMEGARNGAVTDAGGSIVYYELWKMTRDPALLEAIRAYNEDDCRSLFLLRQWLLGLRPKELPWFAAAGGGEEEKGEAVREAEARLAQYERKLLGAAARVSGAPAEEERFRELVFHLLDFHRRAAKPVWWAMFGRHEMTEEELIDDPECIGAMEAAPDHPPRQVKQSMIYTFEFPDQEFKFDVGDTCRRADTLAGAGKIVALDQRRRLVSLKLGMRSGALPQRLSIIPTGPVKTSTLREALYRFADSIIEGSRRYPALEAILKRERPAVRGLEAGEPLMRGAGDPTRQTIEAVLRLSNSYLFVQGPPGAGKTYVGSHVIAALLEKGYRIGVSCNSHKAINNLLEAVEERAKERGLRFEGIKKSTDSDTFFEGGMIRNVTEKKAVVLSNAQLLAGTAWLFSEPELDGKLDYLFVDEAGQVALANLVAMGTSAKNIVLLGDQMQLQQPIQGVHPGDSGESVLDYLLRGEATIAPDRGIFLETTWRMHQEICRFISDAVYDGKLHPEPGNQKQRLKLEADAHPELRPTGIRFIPIRHGGCSQRSEEEAELVRDLYSSLLRQSFVDRHGKTHPMTAENILVVAPYNMQVNLLRRTLPQGARVGTVDKFQGQQAEVVIVSMATSSGDDLPRFMEFLYSKNRLNVALSRARCLAILIASPALKAIRCNTVEQMALVNTLCWVDEYAGGLGR